MDRTKITEGPAIIIFEGKTFYTLDPISWTPGITTFDMVSSQVGNFATRYEDMLGKISFTPVGVWDQHTVLWKPWETPVLGSSLLGTSDRNAVIHTLAGQKFTVYGCGISKIPNLTFSAVKPPSGQVEISALGKNDVEWNNASKRYVQEAAEFVDAGFDPDAVLTQPYTASFGSASPFDSFETEAGIEVAFDLQFAPRKTDRRGTIDLRLSGLMVTTTFTPVGITEAQYNALFGVQGSGVIRGASIGGSSNTLIVSGTGVHFRLYGAVPTEPSLNFDADANRCGPITLKAVRRFSGGALQPLYFVGTAAP